MVNELNNMRASELQRRALAKAKRKARASAKAEVGPGVTQPLKRLGKFAQGRAKKAKSTQPTPEPDAPAPATAPVDMVPAPEPSQPRRLPRSRKRLCPYSQRYPSNIV